MKEAKATTLKGVKCRVPCEHGHETSGDVKYVEFIVLSGNYLASQRRPLLRSLLAVF